MSENKGFLALSLSSLIVGSRSSIKETQENAFGLCGVGQQKSMETKMEWVRQTPMETRALPVLGWELTGQ